MVQNEVEIIKLKAYKNLSTLVAKAYVVVSLMVFAVLTLGLCSIWLGLFLSEIFMSYSAGFGIIAALYLILFVILFAFRKALLQRPFENFMARGYKDIREGMEPNTDDQNKSANQEKEPTP